MATLSRSVDIHKDVWLEIADTRLDEFILLRTAGRYAGAYYLGGYVVEALLKRAICVALDLDELPMTYHSHDLEALLMHSGLWKRMQADPDVFLAFNQISSAWRETMRYERPVNVTQNHSDDLASWLMDSVWGVVPWLKARI